MKTMTSAETNFGSQRRAPPQNKTVTLWLGVAAAFLLLVLAWVALFTAARSVNVESVPLTTKEGRP